MGVFQLLLAFGLILVKTVECSLEVSLGIFTVFLGSVLLLFKEPKLSVPQRFIPIV